MADDLRTRMTMDKSGFSQTLQQVRQETKQFAEELKHSYSGGIASTLGRGAVALLSFEGVKSFAESILSRGKEIRETAEAFDLSTDSVQKWEKALARAGISTATFYKSLETLRGKRQEAREDSKKLGPFNVLGLGVAALGSMSDEDLMLKILNSGGSRPDIANLLGKRAPQIKAATGFLGKATADITTDDIRIMHTAESSFKEANNALKKLFLNFIFHTGMIGHLNNPQNKTFRQRIDEEENRIVQETQDREEANAQRYRTAERERIEYADKRRDAEDKIEEIRRKGLGTVARRASIEKELGAIRLRMREESERTNKDPSVTEGDFIQKRNLKLLEFGAKEAELVQSLKEKPMAVLADSQAKAGLFSRGMIAGAGIGSESKILLNQLHVQKEMSGHLRRIAANGGAHNP